MDFLYYSLTTITTTGYGDIYPLTKTAKVITSIEIVLGVIIILRAAFYEVVGKRKQRRY
ncbi:MAG: potassium channel family protein [Firmicutes bacterium]|nr:potassium channel family protein [Bacillota bacterium]